MRKLFIIIVFVFLFLMTGCLSNDSLVGEWELVSYGDITSPIPAIENIDAYINFYGDGAFNGDVGCNSFSGTYALERDRIIFSNISATEMYCNDTMAQETGVFVVLNDAFLVYQVKDDTLIIRNSDSIVLIKK